MRKHIVLLILFLFILPFTSFAHSKLEESHPFDGQTVQEELKEITMTFNTKIESASTFTLLNENLEPVEIAEITVQDKTLKGTLNNALANGKYTVNWNIVGADGHPIEGSFTFAVAVPNKNLEDQETQKEIPPSNPNNSDGTDPDLKDSEDVEANPPVDNSQPVPENGTSSANQSVYLYLIVFILLIGAILGTWVVFRRKR